MEPLEPIRSLPDDRLDAERLAFSEPRSPKPHNRDNPTTKDTAAAMRESNALRLQTISEWWDQQDDGWW